MNLHQWLIKICFVAFILSISSISSSKTFDMLYEVTVRIDPEIQSSESEYITDAVNILLLRLTGREDAALMLSSEIANNIDNYILQRGFISTNEYYLFFIENQVRSFLKENGLFYWPKDRPVVGIIAFNAAVFNEGITNVLFRETENRGIFYEPIDASDYSLTFEDYLFGNTGKFLSVLKDSHYNYMVLINLTDTPFGPQLSWDIIDPTQGQSTFMSQSLHDGFVIISDYLASKYSVIDNELSIDIVIQQIDSAEDFIKARDYLTALNIVNRVLLNQIQQDKFYFTVDLIGGLEAFEGVIALDQIIYSDGNSGFVLEN